MVGKKKGRERASGQRLAKLGALFAGFAHEVRNPLSTIGLNLGLIKEDFGDAETTRDKRTYKRLSVLESEVKRLESIVDEFLRCVRTPELNLRRTDLNGFLQNVVDFCSPEVQEQGVSLRFYPGQDIGKLDIDVNLLRAALVNLLRNAREACGQGDQIMVSTQRQGNAVLVQVTDTGLGMDEEQLGMAFKPYFSTKKYGTGLGLSITLRIVEEHGGSMDVSAEKGRGTQFTIRLPTAPKEVETS
ncbi:MAG: sensor histidine kinase [Planctomycetota bacterium]|jgi:signal transduction histidine kinase